METTRFPQVSLRKETTAIWFSGFFGLVTEVNYMFPTKTSLENHMETPGFRQVSPR